VNVRVVLDASALLAYARLHGLAVGELVAMVEEEDGSALVGIPAACFLAAHGALKVDERARLVDLATRTDGVTVILPLLGSDTVEVADLDSESATGAAGHSIVETRKHGALIATYLGDMVRRWLPGDDVLDL
jgi:hypothetical protein